MLKKIKWLFLLSLFSSLSFAYADSPVALTYGTGVTGQNIPGQPVTVTNGPSTLVPTSISANGAVVSTTAPLPTATIPSPATLVTGSATALGATTIGTPPANSNLRELVVDVADDSTQTTAGEDTVVVALNGVTVYSTSVYVPATALDTAGVLFHARIPLSNIAFNTGSAGTLTVTLGAALATGAVTINGYFD